MLMSLSIELHIKDCLTFPGLLHSLLSYFQQLRVTGVEDCYFSMTTGTRITFMLQVEIEVGDSYRSPPFPSPFCNTNLFIIFPELFSVNKNTQIHSNPGKATTITCGGILSLKSPPRT